MKDYIYQFYNEGLATTFHLKPVNFVKRHIKNKPLSKILSILIMVLYTACALIFAWIVFWDKYPL